MPIPTTIHAYALTDLATVKSVLGITDASKDGLLTHLINGATDNIESICGRRFKVPAADVLESLDGSNARDLFSKNFPITVFTKLEFKESNNPVSYKEIVAGDFVRDNETGRLNLLTGNFERGVQNYRITYRAGYAVIPADLEQAAISMVIDEFNARKARGVSSESLGAYSVSYSKDETRLDPEIRDVIRRYKKISA